MNKLETWPAHPCRLHLTASQPKWRRRILHNEIDSWALIGPIGNTFYLCMPLQCIRHRYLASLIPPCQMQVRIFKYATEITSQTKTVITLARLYNSVNIHIYHIFTLEELTFLQKQLRIRLHYCMFVIKMSTGKHLIFWVILELFWSTAGGIRWLWVQLYF